jgi:flagellar biosynthesis protein FlhF
MSLETYAGPRVAPLLARAQANLGSNAIVVDVHRARLPNGLTYFELTAADEATALALVSGLSTSPTVSTGDSAVREAERAVPRVIALVGPTGSGKTTTIAKLATNESAFGGRRVGLLNLDTHRTGGMAQLWEHARAARIRMESAFSLGDIPKVKRRLRKCEVILVDTPGRGPAKQSDMAAVTEMLRELAPHEVHLVLPEGLHPQRARAVIAEYARRGVTHLLGTKLDECTGERCVQDLATEYELPMRWLSTGQNVPTDLVTVSIPLSIAAEHQTKTSHSRAEAA